MALKLQAFEARNVEFANFMRRSFYNLVHSERGLVSLEWVALSAVVVVAAIIIGTTLMVGLEAPAQSIGDQLTIAP